MSPNIAFIEINGELVNLACVQTIEPDGKTINVYYDGEYYDEFEFDSEEEANTSYAHILSVLQFNGLLLTNTQHQASAYAY